ncbi:unnamed protein product [Tetraodon nigroviridis]|uniref:(spotted green pufferfish) hypothetical protein n=1 Tax=Tetraodon nigroviridis TaxID=99883 RepID=Q4RKX1_TETNG|nr:unnamed protein product [Tetraodon nigroviridis]
MELINGKELEEVPDCQRLNGVFPDPVLASSGAVRRRRSMLPAAWLQRCAALSSCAAPIERRRQGKFQPFRRLFGRKKKEREGKGELDGLKASSSTVDVCAGVVSDDDESNLPLRQLNPIGSRALSHDSIFVPEESAKEQRLDHSMSQENVSDKVRNLQVSLAPESQTRLPPPATPRFFFSQQKQIARGIKFGQRPPSLRKSEEDEGSTDDEEAPQSPVKVVAQVEPEPSNPESKVYGAQPAEARSPPVRSPRATRVLSPAGTIESINLDAVPQSAPRLDNAAARHKLAIKPKKQRISRKHRRFTQVSHGNQISGVVEGHRPSISPPTPTPRGWWKVNGL